MDWGGPVMSRCVDRPAGSRRGGGRAWCEALERRIVMDGSFPALGDLESPGDAVLRIRTPMGTIDIELLVSAAKSITVNWFLEDLRAGMYDQTVFHRLVSGQLLQ